MYSTTYCESSVDTEDSLIDDNELKLLTITSNGEAEDQYDSHNSTSQSCNIRHSNNSYHYQCYLIINWLCVSVVGLIISFVFCVAAYYAFMERLKKYQKKQAMYGDMLYTQGVFLVLAAILIFTSVSVWICTDLKYKTHPKCITFIGANRRASRHSYIRHQTYIYYIVSNILLRILTTFIFLLTAINGFVTFLILSYHKCLFCFILLLFCWSYCCWLGIVKLFRSIWCVDYDYTNKDEFYRHQWRRVMKNEDRFDYILSNWINKYCQTGYANINDDGIGIDIETEIYKYCGKI